VSKYANANENNIIGQIILYIYIDLLIFWKEP